MKAFSEFKILNHLGRIQAILRGETPLPVTVEIDPTDACNHNCFWCIDRHLRRGKPAAMAPETLFDLVDELARLGVGAVTIKGGGEPLVHPAIDELLLRLKGAGIECGIITNGELLLDHLETAASCCTWVRVSLAAASAAVHQRIHRPASPEAFAKTLEGIRASAQRVFTGVVMVVGKENLAEIGPAAEQAKALGARYIAFKQAVAPQEDLSPEMLMAMDESYHRVKARLEDGSFHVLGSRVYHFLRLGPPRPYDLCKAHHLVGIVCADGGVYACCSTRGDPRFCFGSLHESSFGEIWRSPRRREVLQRIDQGVCRSICLGRTSYMRYDHYNDCIEYLASPDKPHGKFL